MDVAFTPQEVVTLREADAPLMRWHRASYISGCSMSMAQRLIDIYIKHTGTRKRLKAGCSACLVEVFQYLAPRYVKEVAEAQPKAKKNGTKKNERRKAQEQ